MKIKKAKPQQWITIEDRDSAKKQKKYALLCAGRDVLDLGGVDGAFIGICMEAGAKSVISVDRAPLDKRVIRADVIKYLKTTKKKFGAVHARHIIEHLKPEDAVLMMKNVLKRLRPGGIFIIVTQNPKNLSVGTAGFWEDFEHVRPYPMAAVCRNLENNGFGILKSEQDNDSWDNNPVKRIVRAIRSLITGIPYEAPDYFIVAVKKN
ncbi:MAG TPA: methyltransferase domain-containing protein [bacterium]|nr:methyltransferase domain-containing protein [bacterium]